MLIAKTVPTLDDLIMEALGALDRHGQPVDPTRGASVELLGASFELTDPRARLSRSLSRRRVFSAIAELCWYISGSADVGPIAYYMGTKYEENAEENGVVHGAYGPRLFGPPPNDQIQRVTELLRISPSTRRAVVQLFDRQDLGPPRYRDVPCTCTLQFFVRVEKLDMIVSMRSNDVHLGIPHDIFAFTMLQEIVARSLGIELGRYVHMVGSLHRYDKNAKALQAFMSEGYQSTAPTMPPMPAGDPWPQVEALIRAERQLRSGTPYSQVDLPSEDYWADLARLLALWIEAKKSSNVPAARRISEGLTYGDYRTFLNILAEQGA